MDTQNRTGNGRRGWREWLGLSGEREDEAALDSPLDEGTASREPTAREIWLPAKRRLLAQVVDFLIDHDLEVLPFTLTIAYDCVTGGSPRLSQKILERTEQGLPVTLAWLEEASSTLSRDKTAEIVAEMVGKVGDSLEAMTGTMASARTATGEYGRALEHHVDQLQKVRNPDETIAGLTALSRTMIERTHQVETELARSEQQVQSLQKTLEETRRQADQDHLTGLPNRRAFDHMMEREIREAQLGAEPLSVAFCDVDHFKRINDSHGHPAGDRVLKFVAETLNRISDAKCHVARHGGEEFAVLFRGCTVEEAWQRLDDAREEMAGRNLINRFNDTPFGRVTFSGGVADVFGYKTTSAALKAADKALYTAKESGRNQIIIAGRTPAPLREAA